MLILYISIALLVLYVFYAVKEGLIKKKIQNDEVIRFDHLCKEDLLKVIFSNAALKDRCVEELQRRGFNVETELIKFQNKIYSKGLFY